jgi:general stress protein 26
MSAPAAESTAIELTADMQEAINTAFSSGKPVAIAYVDEDGAPQLSYRGSTQALSATELAIWVRNPTGRILESITKAPAVALIYGDFNPDNRRFMVLRGQAHIDASPAMRDRIYNNAHEFERSQDEERKGVAIVITLQSVEGFFNGTRVSMRAT